MTNFLDLKMERITKEAVFNKRAKTPISRSFVRHVTGISPSGKSFNIPFYDTLLPIFKEQTGLELIEGNTPGGYYRKTESDNELQEIKKWVKNQGTRIFFRDCLSLSIALDYNKLARNAPYTDLGSLENRAKKKQEREAISQLAKEVTRAINNLPFYKDADLICSVPSQPDKNFDSPREVTRLVSTKVGKQDVTDGFIFSGEKAEATKDILVDKKWENWENAQISFQNDFDRDTRDKTVILIDDKYQSGITIQYIAMKLQEAGARQVYGLCFVKALSNDDNRNR